MTGAGSANVAYAVETSYLGGAGGTPTYVHPGTNITVAELSIDNFLTRIRTPDQREALRSVAQNFEGALSVSFNLGTADYHDLIFNATDGSSNDIFDSSLPPSAEWYFGLDYESGGSISTAERVAKGWVCTQATVEYQQGDLVRVTLTGPYGDEALNTSLTPGSLSPPGTEADFHEVTLTLDTVTASKLQSATLQLNDLARLERGASRQPIAAVAGPATTTLDATAIYTENDQLELAYGGGSATSPLDSMTGVSGSLDVAPGGTSVSTFELSEVKPATYDWQDLVSADASATEPATFHVNGIKQTA